MPDSLHTAQALADDRNQWIQCKNDFLFTIQALSPVFRGKYIYYLKKAYENNDLIFPGKTRSLGTASGFKALVNSCFACDWVVDIRDPIEKPEYVLEYLARYTHRVAISNNRILSLEDGKVTFTYKNRDTGQTEQTAIDALEFIRRFLLHVL
ncbi:MAG: transposase, partial [Thermodesulfobacteriota bacterium]|nr:transposase [Thermodesulfobacteriota bacterium]